MTKRILALLAVIFWISLIFAQSSQSNPPGSDIAEGILWGHGDLAFHAGEYFVLSVLLCVATVTWGVPNLNLLRYALVISIAIIIGGSDEIYQSSVPGRSMELLDLAFDTFGAVLAVAVVTLLPIYRHVLFPRFPPFQSKP